MKGASRGIRSAGGELLEENQEGDRGYRVDGCPEVVGDVLGQPVLGDVEEEGDGHDRRIAHELVGSALCCLCAAAAHLRHETRCRRTMSWRVLSES